MKSKEAKARIKFNKLLEDMFIYGELLRSVYKELHADHETGAADNK